jgi:hypothetical protein
MFNTGLFQARTLTGTEATADPAGTRRAFALASLSHPRLTYSGWLRFLRRATRPRSGRSGLILVEDPRGYPHALCRYRVDEEPSLAASEDGSRRSLRLSDLVVADVAGTRLLPALAVHGERLARALDCRSVMIELPRAMRNGTDTLEEYDQVAGGVVSRTLSPASGSALRAAAEMAHA